MRNKRNRPPRQQKFPQQEPRQFSPVEVVFFCFLFGLVLWLAVFIHDNAELFEIRVEEEDVTPNFDEYEFDFKMFKERKNFLIHQAYIENDIAKNDDRVQSARKKHLDKKDISQIPEKFLTRWVPDPSRSEGIEEFLWRTKSNGTIIEEYFYMSAPVIQHTKDDQLVLGFATDTQDLLRSLKIGGCNYSPNSKCHHSEIRLQDGDLYMYEILNGEDIQLKLVRVFYIPSFELLL